MKRLFLTLPLISAALMASTAAQEISREQEEQRLREIEEQLQANSRDAEQIRKTGAERELELSNMREDLIAAADLLRESEDRAGEIEDRLTALEAEIAEVQVDLDEQQLAVSDILAALQALEQSKPPALAVRPDDAAEAARAAMALSGIVPDLQARVEQLQATIEKQAALKNQLAVEQRALVTANQRLEERQRLLQTLLDQKEAEFADVTQQIEEIEDQNRRLAEEATSIRDILNRLKEREEEEARLAAEARAPRPTPKPQRLRDDVLSQRPNLEIYNALPATFAAARGMLPLPASGVVTGKFGTNNADGSRQEGIDIAARPGAVVTAPYSGEVVFVEDIPRLGNVFIMEVGGGYHLVLIGMERLEAGVGQRITAGIPVGYMPESTDAPPLHVEIRRNREPINPLRWFRTDEAEG